MSSKSSSFPKKGNAKSPSHHRMNDHDDDSPSDDDSDINLSSSDDENGIHSKKRQDNDNAKDEENPFFPSFSSSSSSPLPLLADPSDSLDLGFLLRPLPRNEMEILLVKMIEKYPMEVNGIIKECQRDIDVMDIIEEISKIIEGEGGDDGITMIDGDDNYPFSLYYAINIITPLIHRAMDYIKANHVKNSYLILFTISNKITQFVKSLMEEKGIGEGENEYKLIDKMMKLLENAWQLLIKHQNQNISIILNAYITPSASSSSPSPTSTSSSPDVNPLEVSLVPPPPSGNFLSSLEILSIENLLTEMKKSLMNLLGPIGSDGLREMKGMGRKREEAEKYLQIKKNNSKRKEREGETKSEKENDSKKEKENEGDNENIHHDNHESDNDGLPSDEEECQNQDKDTNDNPKKAKSHHQSSPSSSLSSSPSSHHVLIPLRRHPNMNVNGLRPQLRCKICAQKCSFFCQFCSTETKKFPLCGPSAKREKPCLQRHLEGEGEREGEKDKEMKNKSTSSDGNSGSVGVSATSSTISTDEIETKSVE